MGWGGKAGALLAILVVVVALVWRQNNGHPFIRIDIPAAEQNPRDQAGTTERADLFVTKEGGYVLDGKSVSDGTLNDAVAKLRSAKHGVVIEVLAAPDAPLASVAAAVAATHIP